MVIIFGGTNDYGDKRAETIGSINDTPTQGTNFYAAFKYLIEQTMRSFPMAQICVVTPIRRSSTGPNSYGITIEQIVNAELDVASYYGCPVLDMYHHGTLNPTFDTHRTKYCTDGLHPTQLGLDIFLSPAFTEFIRKHIEYR